MGTVSPCMGRTTVQVDDETADLLWARKSRGESYDDVIRRLLAATDGRDGEASQ
jgi:predicted CopG family antitoxin